MYAEFLTTGRYAEAMSRTGLVVVPVGSHEAHGRHCPLGTDYLIPARLCADLDARMGDRVVIAPAVNYGYTPGLETFPGTVSVRAEALVDLYTDIGAGLAKWGARTIVFMNGHGGNIPMLTVACDRIAKAGAVAAAISYWATFSRDVLTICGTQGHAGEDETSLVLALDERLVDRGALRRHMRKSALLPLAGPGVLEARFPDAMNGDPAAASADKGRRLYALLLERNLETLERLARGEFAEDM
jgi:creatinine amidohydrolase